MDPATLRAEFDALMSRSGIVVLPERYEGTLANYAALRRVLGLLRQAHSPEAEPSNVFRLAAVLRGLREPDDGTV